MVDDPTQILKRPFWHFMVSPNEPEQTGPLPVGPEQSVRRRVDKTTHKIIFKDESETHVTVEITPKETPPDVSI